MARAASTGSATRSSIGHARVGDAVHERGVGAVLEQSANEIGEQGLVRADRRIDPARTIELVAADHLLVERLAHAVQALEFVLAAIEVGAGEDEHGSERLRIVGGELRIDRVRRREQFARAGEIAHVGVDLAGEHRKAVEAVDLRALDLRIPIGALDQADHQPATRAAREIDQPVDDGRAAFAISLDDEAEPVPAAEIRVEGQASPGCRARGRADRLPRRRC